MKSIKLKMFEPIEIEFYDPSSCYGWKILGEPVAGSVRCFAVGYFLEGNDGEIKVCAIKHENGSSFADALSVPLGCIKNIRRIGLGSGKTTKSKTV